MGVLDQVRTRIVRTTGVWAKGPSLAQIRQDFEELVAAGEPPSPATFDIGGMRAAWFASTDAAEGKGAVLFCHGGGFQIGSIDSHRGLMARLSAASGLPVLGFDYRLAPQFRSPAAHEDTLAAYRWLVAEGFEGSRIAIAGDSAGGNLALATALRARRAGLPSPACLVLISPWLDLAMRGGSYVSRADLDFFSKPEQLRAMARTYLGRERDPGDPAVSPLGDELAGLPPTLVHAGDHDITLDDAVSFAGRAQAQGVDATLKVWQGMFHHFQLFPELREARESIAVLGTFLHEKVGATAL